MIRLLTFTTLFPNDRQPTRGIFVENRLRFLLASRQVSSHVVAPVGYFPFAGNLFGRYGELARVVSSEQRHGIEVDHPRYPVIPKIGMNLAPRLLYMAARRHLSSLLEAGEKFDLIDAHYFYPDGVAAALLAREFGLPLIITARGSDVTLLPRYNGPRKKILWAANQADRIITVSQSLKDELVGFGVDGEGITVLRNGVDLKTFRPLPRDEARARFSMSGPTIVSAGHLIDRKGHDLIITALKQIPNVDLLVVGDGPERGRLEALARQQAVANRVRFLGPLAYEEMPWLFSAADLTVLASSREGWANVLLESMACGTPVMATNVGGAAEIIRDPVAGILLDERNASTLAKAITAALADSPTRVATRAYAEGFSWDDTTKGQLDVFNAVLAARRNGGLSADRNAPE